MRRSLLFGLVLVLLALALPLSVLGDVTIAPGGGTPGTSRNFVLVGHNALFNRGLNAALAVVGKQGRTYVYVGNRTDASSRCGVGDPRAAANPDGCQHVHPGILILDATNPSEPAVVGEIPASVAVPNAAGQPVGVTSRELRVWPEKNLLIELAFRCSSVIHACPAGNDTTFPFYYKFYDISDPVHPQLISTHVTRSAAGTAIKPHEFFLWVDPKNQDRALLWESTPSSSVDPNRPNFVVEDISAVPGGGPARLVAQGNWNQFFPDAANAANYDFDLALHSMTPRADGRTTYLAYLRGGFGVLDTSKIADNEIAAGTVENLNDDLITPVPFLTWGTGPHCAGHTAAGCGESHSAVPLPGRPFALTVDEVYGTLAASSFGWPWGWVRLIDVRNPAAPAIVAEYKLPQNTAGFQGSPGDDPATEQFTSYSSHNPTALRHVVFDDWHSGGLQAIDVADPSQPRQDGWFSPTPLDSVANEDPALSRGPNKVVMWSFPIIKDGLIYAIDIRNGLYILRYTGPHQGEVKHVDFLEGNSNLGDALKLSRMQDGNG
jgi:hypothetical protein